MDKLSRSLGTIQATAINIIDMVGIGPFVTMPFIIAAMNGPQCIVAWLLGALLAFCDASVWSELGAKWPMAGGSYNFLKNIYGENKWGKIFSFLFIWQTVIQAPLVIASGAIGFATYFTYLIPLSDWQQKIISGSVVIVIFILLNRKTITVGKFSVILGAGVIGTILWIILTGVFFGDWKQPFDFPAGAFDLNAAFFSGLGNASIKTIYCFLGYYNVCHLGSEIKNPDRNIPRSMFLSVGVVTILYVLMQWSVLSVLPWQQAKDSTFVVSSFFEKIYGSETAQLATVMILWIALASLFAVMLGYSRIPYAAAVDGNFFPVFARVHPVKKIPQVSLAILAGTAFIFSLLFKLKELITTIIVMRIIVQFLGQAIGLLYLHRKNDRSSFPYRMILFPLPAIIAIIVWCFIFSSSDSVYMFSAFAMIVTGSILFLLIQKRKQAWPFLPA